MSGESPLMQNVEDWSNPWALQSCYSKRIQLFWEIWITQCQQQFTHFLSTGGVWVFYKPQIEYSSILEFRIEYWSQLDMSLHEVYPLISNDDDDLAAINTSKGSPAPRGHLHSYCNLFFILRLRKRWGLAKCVASRLVSCFCQPHANSFWPTVTPSQTQNKFLCSTKLT